MLRPDIITEARAAFAADIAATPRVTLRGGCHLDDYRSAPAYDPVIDTISDRYLEAYAGDGLTYTDAQSWRHYVPHLIDYSLRHALGRSGFEVTNALLNNLRPPDREPPRLASLSAAQEAVVTTFLETAAFGDGSAHQAFACQVLEEWWIPGALYRPAAK